MTPDPLLTDDALSALAHRAHQALPDAPPALLHAALGLWQQAHQPSVLQQALRRVVAVLSFDSWGLSAQAAGMRGQADDSRHLLFSAEGRDVDLRIAPAPGGGWRLAGQVLGPDETGRIALASADGGAEQHSATLDELGEFHLDGLAPGRWTLTLETAHEVVELPTIDVGAQRT